MEIKKEIGIKENQDFILFVLKIADFLFEIGDKKKASIYYIEGATIIKEIFGENEEFLKIILKIADIHMELGDNHSAENMSKKAVLLAKNIFQTDSQEYLYIIKKLANFYYYNNFADEALFVYEQIYEINKTDKESSERLMELYKEKKNLGKILGLKFKK